MTGSPYPDPRRRPSDCPPSRQPARTPHGRHGERASRVAPFHPAASLLLSEEHEALNSAGPTGFTSAGPGDHQAA
jgi:hypothetical protein